MGDDLGTGVDSGLTQLLAVAAQSRAGRPSSRGTCEVGDARVAGGDEDVGAPMTAIHLVGQDTWQRVVRGETVHEDGGNPAGSGRQSDPPVPADA